MHGGSSAGSSVYGGSTVSSADYAHAHLHHSPPRRRITDLDDEGQATKSSLGKRIIKNVTSAAKKTASIIKGASPRRASDGKHSYKRSTQPQQQHQYPQHQLQPTEDMLRQQMMMQLQTQAQAQAQTPVHAPPLPTVFNHPQQHRQQEMVSPQQQQLMRLQPFGQAQRYQLMMQQQLNQNTRRDTAKWIADLQRAGVAPRSPHLAHDSRGGAPAYPEHHYAGASSPGSAASSIYGDSPAASVHSGQSSLLMGGSIHGGSTVHEGSSVGSNCGDDFGSVHGSVHVHHGGGGGGHVGYVTPTLVAGPGHYPLGTTDV